MTGEASRFEWDEAKRLSNIAKHDIDFRARAPYSMAIT